MARNRVNGFQRLAAVTTVLALALVALGGAVRATDSGLECPDWPRCFGLWLPPAELGIWLEHSHRLLAGVVGTAIAGLAIWAVARWRDRPTVLWLSVSALVLVVAQAALGAVVVLRLLEAELVTAHLGMAMVVVACLVGLTFASATQDDAHGSATRGSAPAPRPNHTGHTRRLAWTSTAVAGLCFAQILVGGHVTGIGAGLVYTDFPLMDGSVLPAVATQREAFHVAHRLLAYLLAGGVVSLCAAALRTRRALQAAGHWDHGQRWLVTLPLSTALLVAVQIALGVANLANAASFVTVIPHLAVASWIWTLLVILTLLAHRHARPRAAETRESARPAEREGVRS